MYPCLLGIVRLDPPCSTIFLLTGAPIFDAKVGGVLTPISPWFTDVYTVYIYTQFYWSLESNMATTGGI